jgi:predicted metalloprotease with PDZ domain
MHRRTPAHQALVPFALLAALTAGVPSAIAANSTVAQSGAAPAVPAADKRPYAGTIALDVDATDLDHHILRVRETLPVQPGPLTLLYPRWLPGTHGPYGDANELAGLRVLAGALQLRWQRDAVDPYAFHLEVPAGVPSVQLEFQALTPTHKDAGRIVMTPQMLNLQWEQALLYPAGHEAGLIRMQARARLPAGWQAGGALHGQAGADGWWQFEPASLETLIDSPLFAGRYYQRVELDPSASRPVLLHLVADRADELKVSDAQWAAHRALVAQADKLYGARHYRHYDFLLAVSEQMGGIGLEHHESSENGVKPSYFKDWDKANHGRELLPHEYTHSWNGKFRRPADLWTPDYNTVPMRDSLLWVYEGQTQYWGRQLAARSGLVSPALSREAWASAAARAEHRVGRAWRNLQDTTNEALIETRGGHKDWLDWQRSYDYYDESALVWLDADTLIRQQSGGKRSLDDFARAFFGVDDGRVQPLTYRFEDVVKTLNAVWPHDWARFLRERLDGHDRAPLDGLARAGWKLAYAEQQTDAQKANDEEGKSHDFVYSIGLRIGSEDQTLQEVRWDSPAFRAGLAPGAKLLAVNGTEYKPERLSDAITAAKEGAPLELLVKDGEQYRVARVDYRGGLRYPRLERIEGAPDLLAQIQAPK